ncbi:hypothetical protein SEA_NUBI_77 [Gordonia phage Nubi]|uniref:Uncharacterized protein n=1 Tax=Gordonia phage Nubi TaxID=2588492 RepID=A0A514CXG7_9CAUD|nr:hypothetical protein KNU68_gp77 [Gordonia phage Nubi]QDH85210.1 hypothetical protein SEA_NUBI_77 [Gordonia phage Nubi]
MLWRALALRLTPNLKLTHGKAGFTILWKRPHHTVCLTGYRWGQPLRTPPHPSVAHLPQTPWPHLRLERDLENDFAEIYWPGLGGIAASTYHHTSFLLDGRGNRVWLRDTWLRQGRRESDNHVRTTR